MANVPTSGMAWPVGQPPPSSGDPAGTAASLDAAHVAAADPHVQYAKKAGDTFTGTVRVTSLEKTLGSPSIVGTSYVGTAATGAATSRSITVPTGTVAGDFLLLLNAASNTTLVDVSPTNGFTKYTTQSSPHVGVPSTGGYPGGEWWYRIADSSTLGGASLTFTSRWLALVTVRGCNSIAFAASGGSASSSTGASGVSTTGDRLMLSAYIGHYYTGVVNPQPTTGETETVVSDPSSFNQVAFSVGRRTLTDGQSIPATGWSETNSTGGSRGAGVIALNVGGGSPLPIDTAGVGVAFGGPVTSAGTTLTGQLVTTPSTSGKSGLKVPHGTGPSSPVDGDVWTTTAGVYVRVNGTTVGPLGSAFARTTVTITTASLAADASESGTVTLANGYRLLNVITSRPARVRLYTTAAKRDADASRAIGTDPTGDHGLVLEMVTTASVLTADLSPTVDGFDGKTTPDGAVPYHVTNKDTVSGTCVITFVWIRTE